jgi:hypothetical protein
MSNNFKTSFLRVVNYVSCSVIVFVMCQSRSSRIIGQVHINNRQVIIIMALVAFIVEIIFAVFGFLRGNTIGYGISLGLVIHFTIDVYYFNCIKISITEIGLLVLSIFYLACLNCLVMFTRLRYRLILKNKRSELIPRLDKAFPLSGRKT